MLGVKHLRGDRTAARAVHFDAHVLIDKGSWKAQQRTSGYRLIANADQPCKETNP
jgi:hypothetical protein